MIIIDKKFLDVNEKNGVFDDFPLEQKKILVKFFEYLDEIKEFINFDEVNLDEYNDDILEEVIIKLDTKLMFNYFKNLEKDTWGLDFNDIFEKISEKLNEESKKRQNLKNSKYRRRSTIDNSELMRKMHGSNKKKIKKTKKKLLKKKKSKKNKKKN